MKSLASSENFSLGSSVFIAEVPQAGSSQHAALFLLLIPAKVFCSLQPAAAARPNHLRGLETFGRDLGCLESSEQALHMRYIGHLTEAGNLFSHIMHNYRYL